MAVRDSASLLVGLVVLLHTWRAWAAVEVNMKDKVEVNLGEKAQIPCLYTSDDGIGGLTIEWFYEKGLGVKKRFFQQAGLMKTVDNSTHFTERISVNHSNNTMMLTIRDVKLEDQLDYICAVKGLTDGSGEGRTKLRVFVKPEPPTIEGVQNGISVNEEVTSLVGSCEVKNGYPRPNITWYKDNMPLRINKNEVEVESTVTTQSSGLFSVKSELKKKIVKEDKDALFYCEVTYFVAGSTMMSETRQINVNVLYPSTAVKIWVESPKGKIKEGDSIELHCKGDGNNPSSLFLIKYLKGNANWENDTVLLENVTRQNSGVYECISTNTENFEDISNNTEVFVNYLDPAVVMPNNVMVMAKGNELKATCNALSSLQTKTAWFKNGQEVSEGHTLILKNVTFDTAGVYKCVVTVPEIEGMTTSSSLRVHVEGQPEIMETPLTVIETFDKTVELVCDVRGYPAPTITWIVSDGMVPDSDNHMTTTDYGTKSVVMVDVTSNATAVCNASNEHGTDMRTFNIKAKTIIQTTTPAITTISSVTVTNTTTADITTNYSTTVINTTTAVITTNYSTTATASPPKTIKKESNGFIIAVLIVCVLLLAILGSVLYFLYKKGKICGRAGKQDLTREKSSKDNIVVEMKSDNTEEAILLGVNGEKQPPNDQ
ncbi:melanoma cell adhesion molecule b isoform X6 [Melanotaenia boesemani]|uniref:melanoma cell adhesion molecule b isoform X6 n=1 Tax=Melanotaenia boesemani TaxID=1250792 RepID=UPI001C05B97E|nr:melanoma cell adhesion molecule b isoform X6 [Melanotaenia boesemani]